MRLLTICLLFLIQSVYSQSIEDFRYLKDPIDEESFVSLGLSRASLSNPEAPRPENHSIGGIVLHLKIHKIRTQAGRASITYQNPLLGDLILLLQNVIDNPNNANRSESSLLGSGLTGWYKAGWNLTGDKGPIQPFLGFAHHDYFFGSTYDLDSISGNGWATFEPQGYYFAAGPMGGLRAAVGNIGLMEVRGTYAFSYWRAVGLTYGIRDDSYPKPHWLQLQADFLTKWGLYAGLAHHRVINRGDIPNATRRWDAILGFRFML